MNKINLFLLIILILGVACTRNKQEDEDGSIEAVYAVGKLFNSSGEFLAKKYQLEYVANKVSMPGGLVKMLGLSFDTKKKLNKNEARRFLLNIGLDFLSMINNDNKIYPYLANKPFRLENVEVCIFIFDDNKNELYDPDFAVVELNKGIFIYRTIDPNIPHAYLNRYKETYEEAKAILDKEDSDNLQPRE